MEWVTSDAKLWKNIQFNLQKEYPAAWDTADPSTSTAGLDPRQLAAWAVANEQRTARRTPTHADAEAADAAATEEKAVE